MRSSRLRRSAPPEESQRPEGPAVAPADPGGSQLGRSLSSVGERLLEIVDTAERVAGEIRAEAEEDAAAYVRERRRETDRSMRDLRDRMEVLAGRTERLWRETTRLASDFRELAADLEDAPRRDEPVPAQRPPVRWEPAEDVPREALLRAAQLAIAGRSREEIASELSSEFSLSDPGAVADVVLGHGPASH